MLTQQKVKFEWTPTHHTAFLNLRGAIIQAPILCYPDSNKNTLSTQMHLTIHAEHNPHRNAMEWNFP